MIIELLAYGKKNAVSTRTLCSITGLSVRKLRAEIAKERKEGKLIASSSKGGYYLPADRQEVEEFVRTLDSKSRSIMMALQSARKYLKNTEPYVSDQISIDAQYKYELFR